MSAKGIVLDGRTKECPECRSRRLCSSCQSRIRYGNPNPNGKWEGLWLSEADWRRLLMSAAEFMDLHHEYEQRAGEEIPVDVVDFVDWIRLDVVKDAA
jgi:hypothetical protein